MKYLAAHTAGSLLAGLIYMAVLFLARWAEGPLHISFPSWFFLGYTLFTPFIALFSLPPVLVAQAIVRKAGYTKGFDYALWGLTGGFVLAYMFEGTMVDTAPEWNGYQEIYGTPRLLEYLRHYIAGGLMGLTYALSYWHYLVKPKAG